MNRPVVHFVLTLTCFLGLSVGGSSTSEAGIWPFCHSGWGHPPTTAYYGRTYSYAPVGNYCPPVWRPRRTFFTPAYSPCGVGCASCSEAVCPSGVATPFSESEPKTFVEEEDDENSSGFRRQHQKAPLTPMPDEELGPFLDPDPVNNSRRTGPRLDLKDSRALGVGPLNLDGKITWQPAPQRERLRIRSRFSTPTIARRKVNPNANWVTVLQDTKLVSK